MYIAYLDEFGHVGPYISRSDPKHNDSPVFGLAGLVLPVQQVRGFSTWFFQRKCELLNFEIKSAGQHPALWEKKGASLYTPANIAKYAQLRQFTNRFFNKISKAGGFIFYVGVKKTFPPEKHNAKRLYIRVLLEAIKRIDAFCEQDCTPASCFFLALDEHVEREKILTAALQDMHGDKSTRRRRLIEAPFHLESHRYQTIQAADWIAGLVGRFGAIWADPAAYPENQIFRHYFEQRLTTASRRSGIRA